MRRSCDEGAGKNSKFTEVAKLQKIETISLVWGMNMKIFKVQNKELTIKKSSL